MASINENLDIKKEMDEKYIQNKWEWCKVRFSDPHEGYTQGVFVVEIPGYKFSDKVKNNAISLAANFTHHRETDMQQLERDMEIVSNWRGSYNERGFGTDECDDILMRLKSLLIDLKKGWKG